MTYFSYNDYVDCNENGEMYEIKKVEENIARYEVKNRISLECSIENPIVKILKEKSELKKFLKDFFDLYGFQSIENINYYNNIKSISDKETSNKVVCKVIDKEIFILIKVIDKIDSNISYKMFEHSLNIIENWEEKEKIENKRNPIVIPIVVYTGQQEWKSKSSKLYKKINYITYQHNRINFSYNIININNLKFNELNNMKSKVADELKKLKNKYLQIN